MANDFVERERALQLLDKYVKSDWLRKHSLATEAVMRGLAKRLNEDEETWGVVGLLHDIDFDIVQDPTIHGNKAAELLREEGIDKKEYIQAIRAHNAEGLNLERKTKLDYALTCGETITGLIVATALVMPDKKLSSVKPSSVVKRMKKKDFARKVSRENILLCEKIGLDINEFAELAVRSMQKIADQLGL